jgi:hypothetical protein
MPYASCTAASRRRIPWSALLAVMVACAVVPPSRHALSAAASPELTATWRDREIRIDGNDEEWRDLLRPVQGQKFSVAIANDNEALYFCLVSKDRVTATQIEQQGLMLWFPKAGDKKRGAGVRFPVDRVRTPMRPAGDRDAGESDVPPWQQAFEMLGPESKDARRVPFAESGGVEGRVGVRGDLLVYEIKVPLKTGAAGAYALALEPGGTARLEMRTPEWRGPVPMQGGRGSGGVMVGVGAGNGGRGMAFPGMDTTLLRPLDVAATLRLAVR